MPNKSRVLYASRGCCYSKVLSPTKSTLFSHVIPANVRLVEWLTGWLAGWQTMSLFVEINEQCHICIHCHRLFGGPLAALDLPVRSSIIIITTITAKLTGRANERMFCRYWLARRALTGLSLFIALQINRGDC